MQCPGFVIASQCAHWRGNPFSPYSSTYSHKSYCYRTASCIHPQSPSAPAPSPRSFWHIPFRRGLVAIQLLPAGRFVNRPYDRRRKAVRICRKPAGIRLRSAGHSDQRECLWCTLCPYAIVVLLHRWRPKVAPTIINALPPGGGSKPPP